MGWKPARGFKRCCLPASWPKPARKVPPAMAIGQACSAGPSGGGIWLLALAPPCAAALKKRGSSSQRSSHPAQSTFSIWGVFYGLLILAVILLIAKKNDAYCQRIQDEAGPLFWAACVLNIAWIVTFSFLLIELSVLFILVLTVTLALLCHRLLALAFGLYTVGFLSPRW